MAKSGPEGANIVLNLSCCEGRPAVWNQVTELKMGEKYKWAQLISLTASSKV